MNRLLISRNCGFFSDFLTGLAGIMYLVDNNQKFYVEWHNYMYGESPTENLYSKFFNQIYELEDESEINNTIINLTPYGYYFPEAIGGNLSDNEILRNLKKPAQAIIDLKIINNKFFDSIDKNYFKGLKVLGVHKRGTDHAQHGSILSNESVLLNINEEFKNNSYDKVYLMTDDIHSLNFFKKELGETLIYTDCTRVGTQTGLHFSNLPNKTKLAEEVLIDSFLLSLTDFKLITQSNVSTFSLLCDLKDNFRYLDKHVQYR